MVERIMYDLVKLRSSFENVKLEIKDGTEPELQKIKALSLDIDISNSN